MRSTYLKHPFFRAALLCAFFACTITYIHLALPSMYNQFSSTDVLVTNVGARMSESYGKGMLSYHSAHPVFVRRQFTTRSTFFLSELLGVGVMPAFVLLQTILLFLAGIAVYATTSMIGLKKYWVGSVVAFYTTFPVFFAFLPSIWSYDDMWQYAALVMACGAFWKKKYILFVPTFLLALAARESSVLLLPGFFVLMMFWQHTGNWIKRLMHLAKSSIVWFGPPVGLYVLYYVWLGKVLGIAGSDVDYITTERFRHLMYNFQDLQYSLEALVAPLLVLGIFVYIVRYAVVRNHIQKKYMPLIFAFLVTAAINTIIVYIGGHVREMRLFALPLVFLWPLMGYLYTEHWKSIRADVIRLRKKKVDMPMLVQFLLFLCGLFASGVLSFFVYTSVGGGPVNVLYQWWLFGTLVLLLSRTLCTSVSQ